MAPAQISSFCPRILYCTPPPHYILSTVQYSIFLDLISTVIAEHKKSYDPNYMRDFIDEFLKEMKRHEGRKSTFDVSNDWANASKMLPTSKDF